VKIRTLVLAYGLGGAALALGALFVRWGTRNIHVHEVHAHEVHACEMRIYEVHIHEVHTREVHAHEVHASEIHVHEMHAHEGFCEDLARQNTVAHLSQLQLGFRRRRIWVSVLSHIGFSHRRGVLKTTI
jgi:hypothetical protein